MVQLEQFVGYQTKVRDLAKDLAKAEKDPEFFESDEAHSKAEGFVREATGDENFALPNNPQAIQNAYALYARTAGRVAKDFTGNNLEGILGEVGNDKVEPLFQITAPRAVEGYDEAVALHNEYFKRGKVLRDLGSENEKEKQEASKQILAGLPAMIAKRIEENDARKAVPEERLTDKEVEKWAEFLGAIGYMSQEAVDGYVAGTKAKYDELKAKLGAELPKYLATVIKGTDEETQGKYFEKMYRIATTEAPHA